jgi:hypothetical protein
VSFNVFNPPVRLFAQGLLCMGVGLLGVCSTPKSVAPQAAVCFLIDAPLCSSIMPVQFSIDNVQVATDTFVVGIAGSRAFVTSLGTHTLSARTVSGYVWPEKQVTVVSGDVVTDSLPFHCS